MLHNKQLNTTDYAPPCRRITLGKDKKTAEIGFENMLKNKERGVA